MDIHKNARLTPLGRERLVKMVLGGQTPKAVSEAVGVCPRTVRKWVERYQREGMPGLQDRSSRPRRLRRPTPQPVIEFIEALRRQRLTGKAIAVEVGVSPATVSRVLRRLSQAQWQALAYLSRQEGVNQVTLAESLDIHPMTLARLIDRLQEAGLVARRPDPADRRAFRLYLTENAQPLLGRMRDLAAGTREEAMAGLADDRKLVLIDALRHMKRNLVAAESAADGTGGEPEEALSNAAGSV